MLVLAALHLPTVHWRIPGTHTVLDFTEVVGIGAGLVVVIVVAIFLIVRARSARRTVSKLVSSADPAERIAGVDIAATGELARHVRALRRLLKSRRTRGSCASSPRPSRATSGSRPTTPTSSSCASGPTATTPIASGAANEKRTCR